LNSEIVCEKSSGAEGGSKTVERQFPRVLKELPRVLETRERMLNADAKSRETLVVEATLRSDISADNGRIHLRYLPSGLDALITDISNVSQQEQLRPQEHAPRLHKRCKLAAATRAIASIEVAYAS